MASKGKREARKPSKSKAPLRTNLPYSRGRLVVLNKNGLNVKSAFLYSDSLNL